MVPALVASRGLRLALEGAGWVVAAAGVMALGRSEPAYVVAFAAAARLGHAHPGFGLAAPVLWVAAVGTEFRPDMAGLFGVQYRLFDAVLFGAVVGLLPTLSLSNMRRPWLGTLLALVALAVATVATPLGSPAVAESTLHQAAVMAGAYLLAAQLLAREPTGRVLVLLLIAAATAAGLKVAGLWLAGIDVSGGPGSALQAFSRIEPGVLDRRVLLVGGSLFTVIGVPISVAYLLRSGRSSAWALAVAILCAVAVLMGLTRTNFTACAVGTALAVPLALLSRPDTARSPSAATAISVVATAWIAGIALMWGSDTNPLQGALERTTSEEAQAVSIGFRGDEAEAVLRAVSGVEWVLGKGLGGRFEFDAPGTDPQGNEYVHSWPLWVFLKAGAVGLILVCVAFGVAAWTLLRGGSRATDDDWYAVLGVALVTLLVASLAVNSLPLAEGELVLGCCLAAAARAATRSRADSWRPYRRRSATT